MSQFTVRILATAQRDADRIFDWIKDRSPEGALRWYDAFLAAADGLSMNPFTCGIAAESEDLDFEVRQKLFRTRRGGAYRLLFMIAGEEVHVLRVRGPGQPPLTEVST
jgi:plasmid stabilization system protein ParE